MSNYQLHKAIHAKHYALRVLKTSRDEWTRLLAQMLLEQSLNQLQQEGRP